MRWAKNWRKKLGPLLLGLVSSGGSAGKSRRPVTYETVKKIREVISSAKPEASSLQKVRDVNNEDGAVNVELFPIFVAFITFGKFILRLL